jgi:tetratricopeptide (TPR) repeat protein
LRTENKNRDTIKAGVFTAILFFLTLPTGARGAVAANSNPIQRVIHDAEELSLTKDRDQACALLVKSLKKSSKDDSRTLKAKLVQLSRYFYTDKGFSSYLEGKDFFDKQKFQDAADKFAEADELDNSNVDILHYMTLANLWLGRIDQAEVTSRRASRICPIDQELVRDNLSVEIAQELWTQAATTAQELAKDYSDGSAQTLKDWAEALAKQGQKDEAAKLLQAAIEKDRQFPESYFWLASLRPDQDATKLLTQYVDLCKNKLSLHYDREPRLCLQTAEAEKRIKP